MILDTAYLKGRLLDFAVATAAGYEISKGQEYVVPVWEKCPLTNENEVVIDFNPTQNAIQAKKLMSIYGIYTSHRFDEIWDAYANVMESKDKPTHRQINGSYHQFSGTNTSALEAAMNCYLNIVVGRAIIIPDNVVNRLKGNQELVIMSAEAEPKPKKITTPHVEETTTVKLKDLDGEGLSWASAKALGILGGYYAHRESTGFKWENVGKWNPMSNILQGFPLVKSEGISIAKLDKTLPNAMAPHEACWSAHKDGLHTMYAPDPLTAVVRCVVASKLGYEIEVPSYMVDEVKPTKKNKP